MKVNRFKVIMAVVMASSMFFASCVQKEAKSKHPLNGKKLLFLGSSVTYGSANNGISFVEYLQERNRCTCYKYAVSGTTLTDTSETSYVSRLKRETGDVKKVDHVIVQLSTNDAGLNRPLGTLSDSKNIDDLDTSTIIGAIEYIIAYCETTWKCDVSFYTGTKYDSKLYGDMVKALHEIADKWNIGVLDMWNDTDMNAVSAEDYKRYMADPVHPTGAGYLEWWTPKFEAFLSQY